MATAITKHLQIKNIPLPSGKEPHEALGFLEDLLLQIARDSFDGRPPTTGDPLLTMHGYAKGDSAGNEKQEIYAETPKGTTPSWHHDKTAGKWYEGPTNPNQKMYEYKVGTYYVSMRDTLVASEIRSNLNGKGFYSLKIFVDYVTMIPDLVHRYGEK